MNATLHASTHPLGTPAKRPFPARIALAIGLLVLVAIALAVALPRPGLSGTYAGADGTSILEFRGSRVYITTALGTTFVAAYEVDGDRVIIRGAGGAQVYTRDGNTLDGGVGIRFVKQ